MQDVAILNHLTGFQRASTHWQDQALCKGDREDIWFPATPGKNGGRPSAERLAKYQAEVAFAISICQECPVMAECHKDAEDREEVWGVWGGEDFYVSRHSQGRALRELEQAS